jgi:hypothetical protein
MHDEPFQITIKEDFVNLSKGTWAAELAISVDADAGGSEMTVNGSIAGMGPIQKNHLKGQMGRFLNALATAVESSEASTLSGSVTGSGSVADELTKLGELHAQGILSAEEFSSAKAKLLG